MKLHDLDGQEFELEILGYESPNIEYDEFDSNWLNIQIKVSSKKGKWQDGGPFLDTAELRSLAKWFFALSQSKSSKEIFFTEPDIKFKIISKVKNIKLRIYFEIELRPGWAREIKWENFFIDLTLDKNELIQAAGALENDVKQFPYKTS